jgi:DeoR/GlpR family transcriptional regulator of sugar metabolism
VLRHCDFLQICHIAHDKLISREIILVADASKFSKRSMTRIAPFSEIDTVITDSGLDPGIQAKIRAMGCSLILV